MGCDSEHAARWIATSGSHLLPGYVPVPSPRHLFRTRLTLKLTSSRPTPPLRPRTGVAFSPTPSSDLISRLGHGKGYYDQYISQYRTFCQQRGVDGPKLGECNLIIESSSAGRRHRLTLGGCVLWRVRSGPCAEGAVDRGGGSCPGRRVGCRAG